MTRAHRDQQRVIDALGFELIRELVDRPGATEEEIRRLIRDALKSARRRVEVKVEVQPYEDEKERIERVLDWLNPQKGDNDAEGSR